MITLMLGLLFTVQDTVSGSPYYLANIGEYAVVHYYDRVANRVDGVTPAFLTLEARMAFIGALNAPDVLEARSREQATGDRVKLHDLNMEQSQRAIEIPALKGQVVTLQDLTRVKVLAYASFTPRSANDDEVLTDSTLVEVIDGPHQGQRVWVRPARLRVLGSKHPAWVAAALAAQGADPKPVRSKPKRRGNSLVTTVRPDSQLVVVDSSWQRTASGNFVQVHARVRNVSGRTLQSITAKVIFEDATGGLISSEDALVGSLEPGETKTFSNTARAQPGIDHYNFEFEGREQDGARKGLSFQAGSP